MGTLFWQKIIIVKTILKSRCGLQQFFKYCHRQSAKWLISSFFLLHYTCWWYIREEKIAVHFSFSISTFFFSLWLHERIHLYKFSKKTKARWLSSREVFLVDYKQNLIIKVICRVQKVWELFHSLISYHTCLARYLLFF